VEPVEQVLGEVGAGHVALGGALTVDVPHVVRDVFG
jgi:hypothetical protein